MKRLRTRESTCEGKVAFSNFNQASEAAGRRQVKRMAYHCNFCGKYHVGQSAGKKRRTKGRAQNRVLELA